MSERVVVAMSGGVDSSLAAALLVERGYEAVGVTMKLLPRADTGFGCCGSPADTADARRVCERLGIPHYVVDMAELFEDKVIRPFVEAYASARTPNPCVECNRSLKFGHLLGLARAWGASKVATGHYARAAGGRLLRAVDEAKDQTYFLYSLTEKELPGVLFPVGELTKAEVRRRAAALGLQTADKPESQEICFVPGRDYEAFVSARAPEAARPGPITDTEGRALGTHRGLASYTVGQRKRLGLSGPQPRYVVALEGETNTLVVGGGDEVRSIGFEMEALSWTGGAPSAPLRAQVRIRHRHRPAEALVTPRAGGASVLFDEPQRAVTPGQAAVFYSGAEVLGGGTITRRIR